MRYPQIIVYADHDRLEAEVRTLAAEHRWLLRPVRQARALASAVRDLRPTVVLLEADPADNSATGLELLCETHLARPDVPVVVVSPRKLPLPDRTYWSAAVMDIGAAFVVFPPLERSVLEDLTANMMRKASTVAESVGTPEGPKS